ncbi:hypothetical protein R1flu_008145 [Riccia fluitans]|uniref:F-box domain-containing protein n=1 Tax=Riccia fluitans TaxID=41844 RepID=A0ABD1YBI4_9MARC
MLRLNFQDISAASKGKDPDEDLELEETTVNGAPGDRDCVVKAEVWPHVAADPFVVLHLRIVNRVWRQFIETTLEWTALSMVRGGSRLQVSGLQRVRVLPEVDTAVLGMMAMYRRAWTVVVEDRVANRLAVSSSPVSIEF